MVIKGSINLKFKCLDGCEVDENFQKIILSRLNKGDMFVSLNDKLILDASTMNPMYTFEIVETTFTEYSL